MGYRSDVLIRIKESRDGVFEEEWVKLLLLDPPWLGLVKEIKAEVGKTSLEDQDMREFSITPSELIFYVEDWKWYPDYEIVDSFTKLYNYFVDLSEGGALPIDCCYARVGEEDGDIERLYENNGYELFNIYSQISY